MRLGDALRMIRIVACVFAVGCGSHREPPAPRGPVPSQDMLCTLRISPRGTFVDGDPMSRADAVARCKRTAGAIVVIETNTRSEWDPTTCAFVMIEDETIKAKWDETRSALQREGVRVHVRGSTSDLDGRRRPIVTHTERRGCEVLPPLVDPRRTVRARESE